MPDGPYITHFASPDVFHWDTEGDGMPSSAHFGNALQLWCVAQNRVGITVAEAALAFNVAPDLIRQAVEDHYWMFLAGAGDDATIEHEGE